MKKQLLLTVAAMMITATIFAQAPSKMSYQSVIRNASNDLVNNQAVGIRVQIIQGSEFGAAKYVETHTVTTNANGLATMEIGTGTVVTGNFSSIDWTDGPYFIKTETDPAGGTSYSLTTVSEMMSVPYAMLAEKASYAENVLNSATLNKAYHSGSPGAGRNIIADEGAVLIEGHDGIQVSGKSGQGADIVNFDSQEGAISKMFFNPKKRAFRVGFITSKNWDKDSVGVGSFASGYNAKASGTEATAMGSSTIASEAYSTAMGVATEASGSASTAMGYRTKASGNYSTSMGSNTEAKGSYSTAMGYQTTASGDSSTAMGYKTTASGQVSTAMGDVTIASGYASTAMGYDTRASGSESIAMGYETKASGNESTAMGMRTQAIGDYSTAMGYGTIDSADYSTAMGYYTTAAGIASTAMGYNTTASGYGSTAMGYHTEAIGKYSTTIGSTVTVKGDGSMYLADNSRSSSTGDTRISNNTFYGRFANGYYLYTDATDSHLGARLAGGANSWSVISDSAKKENFLPVNGKAFLNKIASMKLTTWNYKSQDPNQFRHYGPMAQDFFNAFGHDKLGTVGNDTTIASADFAGVSFIAIQALVKENKSLKEKLRNVNNEIVLLKSHDLKNSETITALENKIQSINQQSSDTIQFLKAQYETLSTDLKEFKKYATMQKEVTPVAKN